MNKDVIELDKSRWEITCEFSEIGAEFFGYDFGFSKVSVFILETEIFKEGGVLWAYYVSGKLT